jgi:hypothetical protein
MRNLAGYALRPAHFRIASNTGVRRRAFDVISYWIGLDAQRALRTTHSSGQKLAAGTRGHRCLNQSVGAADFSPTRLRDWWFGASKSGLFL